MKKADNGTAKKAVKTKPASVMTTTGNVKTEEAPAAEPEHISVAEEAKRIAHKAKSADSFEYDDTDRAKEVFAKLPEDEFVIKEGEKTVIQKL